MKYLYADIIITPYVEIVSDIISATLGNLGYDTFEPTDNGVKAYIEEGSFDENALKQTIESINFGDFKLSYTIHELENKDWNEEWEQNSFDPILEREFGIKLNPRMAFGSGSHETTYQITSIIQSYDYTNQRVLDMGTGTGVLGIAMALRGAKEVVAIDVDEFSVENSRENFALNNINNVEIIHGDASAIEGTFDTIVANIHKNILKADMPTYVEHLSKNGTIIFSGFYSEDVPEMKAAAEQNSLTLTDISEKNSWTVLTFKKTL